MSEKVKLNQMPKVDDATGPNAPRSAFSSSTSEQPGGAGQGKQAQRSSDDALRRAQTHMALTAEIKSRNSDVGTNTDERQAPPLVTAGKVETGVNLPPDAGKAGRGDMTSTPVASVSPAPASGHDRPQAPGDRARAYRARAMRDQAHAERYGGWTDEYVKSVRRRRSQSRKYRQKSFESAMLADGVEINGSISEEYRELGYTVPKLSELVLESGRHKIKLDTLIALLKILSNEKLRLLGYTLPKIGEFLLEAASLETEFDTLMAALHGLKASKG